MKFKNFKTIVSAGLLGLSGVATAADIQFYLPDNMVNYYQSGGAKLFVITVDGKSCKIKLNQNACTVNNVSAYSSVARVDWYNSRYTYAKDLLASTAFVVRYKNPEAPGNYSPEANFSSVALPVGKVRIMERNGTNTGSPSNSIGLYLVPANDLLKLPVTNGGNANLPSTYFSGLKHYEISHSAITYTSVESEGNVGMEFPVLAGTYAPITYKPQLKTKGNVAQAHFLSDEQSVVVGMGTTSEILVDSTIKYLPMDIFNNLDELDNIPANISLEDY